MADKPIQVVVQEVPPARIIDKPNISTIQNNDPYLNKVLLRNGQPPQVIPNVMPVRVLTSAVPGEVGGDLHYIFEQLSPATTWYIFHGLGKYPSVSVEDNYGRRMEGDITWVDLDRVEISWGIPVGGKAFLN